MRILFVDDESDILHGLQCSLRRQRREWDMQFCSSGREALALLAQEPFDVVVCDVQMPGMDGVDLLTRVGERFPTTIRIILSGHAGEDTILRAVGPAHQYLAKPCDPDELHTKIRAAVALRNVLTDDKVKRVVARLQSIPSLPALYQEILAELRSQEPSLRRVSEIVAKDVGMTAKVLQLVNSAFFGLASEVTDASQAVMHLGTNTVRALALSTGVFSQMSDSACDLSAIWSHSTSVALLARRIAKAQGASKEVMDASYQAGFLHDIGHLVIAVNMPTEYARLRAASTSDRATATARERTLIGATHAEVGGYLLGVWGLPDLVVQAVTFHDEPSRFPTLGFSPLAAVHVADAIECALTDPAATSNETPEFDRDFLAAAGLEQETEPWTAMCREVLEQGVTQ